MRTGARELEIQSKIALKMKAKRIRFEKQQRADFAAMAMQGLIGSRSTHNKSNTSLNENPFYLHLAQDSVRMADALIKELNKEIE